MRNRESCLKLASLLVFALIVCGILIPRQNAGAWSNGGYSSDPNNPDYGTHDWIAEHAMNLLPLNESSWLSQNRNAFLYGTEAPDDSSAIFQGHNGYGDTAKHHNYYSGTTCTDPSAAQRAKEEYQKALNVLKSNGSLALAAWYAGAMTHYVDDMACWAHVMSNEAHHSDYENQVDFVTDSYSKNTFTVSFDGTLDNISAFDASESLGLNTYRDDGGSYTASWMNSSFLTGWANVNQWSSEYKSRAGESLNLAVNIVADVLHTLTVEGKASGGATQGAGISLDVLLEIGAIAAVVLVAVFLMLRRRH